jgi:ferredoxin-thioredoxin reductase catalytic subunit
MLNWLFGRRQSHEERVEEVAKSIEEAAQKTGFQVVPQDQAVDFLQALLDGRIQFEEEGDEE